jgi:hypothetical protein
MRGIVRPQPAFNDFFNNTLPALYAKSRHTVVKPGDIVPVVGLDWRIVSSAGQVLKAPLTGARGSGAPNGSCASFKPQAPDPTENAQSVGSVITFGKFRVVQLGDLTWNKEFELMCPNNPIGVADLMVASHHGLPISNSEVLVHAVRPRVIIVNNAIRKGASPEAMKTYFSSPGLEDVWQSHFSLLGGQEYTVPGIFIANGLDQPMSAIPVEPMAPPAPGANLPPPPTHNGPAYWIKVSANSDGTFTVTNQRNGFAKTYTAPGSGTN